MKTSKLIKNLILAGFLTATINHCAQNTVQSDYISDLNNDSRTENIHLQSVSKETAHEIKHPKQWNDYNLVLKLENRNKRAKQTKNLTSFYRKPEQIIIADLTGDNHQDILYVINTREMFSLNQKQKNFALRIIINNGFEEFNEEKTLATYISKPSEVQLNHNQNNTNPDIMVLYDTKTNVDTTGDDMYGTHNDFRLEILINKGNGNFSEPELINDLARNPEYSLKK